MSNTVPPIIEKVVVRGFRSIANQTITFANPTFLVGRNGAGKSNVADAVAFLADAMNTSLAWAIDRRGGMRAISTRTSQQGSGIGFGIHFGTLPPETIVKVIPPLRNKSRYSFEFEQNENGGFRIVREQAAIEEEGRKKHWLDVKNGMIRTNFEPFNRGGGSWLMANALAMSVTGGSEYFLNLFQTLRSMRVYGIEPAAVRALQDPVVDASLKADGSNAAGVLEGLASSNPEMLRRIQELLAAITPGITAVKPVKYADKRGLEFTQSWGKSQTEFDAYSMSSGTLRALGILLAVFQESNPSLLVIEEPENSMHPGATSVLLDVLRYACSSMQVLVTTQSPEVLDAEWIEDKHLRVVAWERGQSVVTEVPQASKTALREHLMTAGELFRSEALVPPLDRPSETRDELFADLH
jgi:predicted ATPase